MSNISPANDVFRNAGVVHLGVENGVVRFVAQVKMHSLVDSGFVKRFFSLLPHLGPSPRVQVDELDVRGHDRPPNLATWVNRTALNDLTYRQIDVVRRPLVHGASRGHTQDRECLTRPDGHPSLWVESRVETRDRRPLRPPSCQGCDRIPETGIGLTTK